MSPHTGHQPQPPAREITFSDPIYTCILYHNSCFSLIAQHAIFQKRKIDLLPTNYVFSKQHIDLLLRARRTNYHYYVYIIKIIIKLLFEFKSYILLRNLYTLIEMYFDYQLYYIYRQFVVIVIDSFVGSRFVKALIVRINVHGSQLYRQYHK